MSEEKLFSQSEQDDRLSLCIEKKMWDEVDNVFKEINTTLSIIENITHDSFDNAQIKPPLITANNNTNISSNNNNNNKNNNNNIHNNKL
jgi:hypothetical protein